MTVWLALGLAEEFPAGYAGSEVCAACHEDLGKAFSRSGHGMVDADTKRGWKGRGCESCHGPGAKHAETAALSDIANPAKLQPAQANRGCLTCHLNRPTTHAGRIESSHARGDVSCVACHKVHADRSTELASRKPAQVNAQCGGCHSHVVAQFRRPYKHRLLEGAMTCTDCHNPHASQRPALVQSFAANEPGCFKCHGDKRGPFTFEHSPVRLEGCGSCHEPHGSANPRMLVRHEVRLVCLECHSNLPSQTATSASGGVPPAFHDIRTPRFRNCTVCHQKVHGSFVDRSLLR